MKTNNPYSKFLGKEDIVQMQVCRYIKYQYPKAVLFHAPNEGKRTPFEQFKLKSLGVSSGFPDLLIIHNSKVIGLEIKQGKNKATPNQIAWIETLNNNGIPAKVCTGFDQCREWIDQQLAA